VAGPGEQTRIRFERSGGFAGVTVHTDVDTAELPEDEAVAYHGLLAGLDLAALAHPAAARAGRPDRFQYDIDIRVGDQSYQLSYGEQELPAQLRPLVDRLTERAHRR
jgi:hypothetical protein